MSRGAEKKTVDENLFLFEGIRILNKIKPRDTTLSCELKAYFVTCLRITFSALPALNHSICCSL